jgi:hypothetical protein
MRRFENDFSRLPKHRRNLVKSPDQNSLAVNQEIVLEQRLLSQRRRTRKGA